MQRVKMQCLSFQTSLPFSQSLEAQLPVPMRLELPTPRELETPSRNETFQDPLTMRTSNETESTAPGRKTWTMPLLSRQRIPKKFFPFRLLSSRNRWILPRQITSKNATKEVFLTVYSPIYRQETQESGFYSYEYVMKELFAFDLFSIIAEENKTCKSL